MNTIEIRRANINDMAAVLNLILELARFEESESSVVMTTEKLQLDGFKEHPDFICWVAEYNGTIAGMAFVYQRYSTWVGPALHLEDLIITKSMRGKGIGGRLLDEVVKYGSSQGVRRISWEVLDWNEPAIKFYEERGARIMRDWHVVQLDEVGIKNYLDRI
ncbi:MAG: GNAT family N-acetyltransferase [Eudoraea sp.]|nr:GNAT family N-acetyltransferase [Eudoraea sp.]